MRPREIPFEPCPGLPACGEETKNQAAFHAPDWAAALRTARGRSKGQKARYSVRFNGKHWIVEKEGGGL